MKKRTSLVILTLSAGFLLAACGEQAPAASSQPAPAASSSPVAGTKVTVTFNTNGGSAVAAQEIEKGGKATKPANPTKEGATFVNWYADEVLATEFDFDEAINANTTVYAKWQEAATPDSSSEGEPAEEDDKLYFKDVSWWNNMGAYTVAQFDEGIPTKMTPATVYDPVGKFNIWSIDIPAEAVTVTFYRSYDDPDHDVTMDLNGPKTVAVTLADAGDHNMYDISGVASYDWDHPADVTGVWGDFEGGSDPVIPPSEDSSGDGPVTPSGDYSFPEGSTPVSWYIRGVIGGAAADWTTGIQLGSNPAKESDKGCILNLSLAVGDEFKVTDGTTWYGYEKIDTYQSDANKGLTNFQGKNDGNGGKNIECTVAGAYDIYVNSSGVFWIQDHAA